MICTLGGASAFAQTAPLADAKSSSSKASADAGFAEKQEAQRGSSLRADISKLVAEAKAGKGLSVSDPQNRPAQSNSLSKTVKIAIVAGVAAAIILTILFVYGRNHLFD